MTLTGHRWQSPAPGAAALELHPFQPPDPGPGELLVEVAHAALNFSDGLMLEDRYQVRPERPFTPGQELAGRVLLSGTGARIPPGTLIASKVVTGGFATHALVRDSFAIPLPDIADTASAAALPVSYTTAYVALTELAPLPEGASLLVLAAAGGAGLAAVQVAVARGLSVIALASTLEKREFAQAAGAAHAIDSTDPDWPRIAAAFAPEGVAAVFDPVGGDATLQALPLLTRDGRLLIVGFAGGNVAKIPTHRLLLNRIAAIGVNWDHDRDTAMMARVTRRLQQDFDAGLIAPQIDLRPGLRSLPQALDDLAARRTMGKVVLAVGGDAEAVSIPEDF